MNLNATIVYDCLKQRRQLDLDTCKAHFWVDDTHDGLLDKISELTDITEKEVIDALAELEALGKIVFLCPIDESWVESIEVKG